MDARAEERGGGVWGAGRGGGACGARRMPSARRRELCCESRTRSSNTASGLCGARRARERERGEASPLTRRPGGDPPPPPIPSIHPISTRGAPRALPPGTPPATHSKKRGGWGCCVLLFEPSESRLALRWLGIRAPARGHRGGTRPGSQRPGPLVRLSCDKRGLPLGAGGCESTSSLGKLVS